MTTEETVGGVSLTATVNALVDERKETLGIVVAGSGEATDEPDPHAFDNNSGGEYRFAVSVGFESDVDFFGSASGVVAASVGLAVSQQAQVVLETSLLDKHVGQHQPLKQLAISDSLVGASNWWLREESESDLTDDDGGDCLLSLTFGKEQPEQIVTASEFSNKHVSHRQLFDNLGQVNFCVVPPGATVNGK